MAIPSLPHPSANVVDDDKRLMREWRDFFSLITGQLSAGVVSAIALTYNTGTHIVLTNAAAGSTFTITPSDTTNFTIAAPTSPLAGQVITYTIRRTAGALGTITWNAVFKMASWTNPGAASSRSITFHYDGTNWIERYRSAADIPN